MQDLLDLFRERLWRCLGGIPLDHSSFRGDQEFSEIPLDRLSVHKARSALFKQREERMGISAVDLEFLRERERYLKCTLTKASDVII